MCPQDFSMYVVEHYLTKQRFLFLFSLKFITCIFLYYFYAKVEEKKEFLTTRGRLWMTIYGQLVS